MSIGKIQPQPLSYQHIERKQVHHAEMKPLSEEAAKNLPAALKFAAVKGLGPLQFYFKELALSSSGTALPEFLQSNTNLAPLQKLAVVLTLFDQLQNGERPLPALPGQPITIDGPVAGLINSKKTASAQARLELATKKQDPMALLKPAHQHSPVANPNALAHHGRIEDHFRTKTAKSALVKQEDRNERTIETRVIQLDKLAAPLLKGILKNPEAVARNAAKELKLLAGV